MADDPKVRAAFDATYLALGRAISDWGYVEKRLSHVFSSCFPIQHSAPAGHAFFEPHSFQTQWRMTSRAVYIAVNITSDPDQFAGRWCELEKRLIKLSTKRNRLAHGSVTGSRDANGGGFSVYFEAFHSAKAHNKTAARHLDTKTAKSLWKVKPEIFSADDLAQLSADFYTLSEDLLSFSQDLSLEHNT